METNTLSELIGKVIVRVNGAEQRAEVLTLHMRDGTAFVFYHDQDCCESVEIEDVCGDVSDLIGTPLLQAEEVVNEHDPRPVDPFTGAQCTLEYEDSQTWTFYKFATIKGSVTLRWLGQSNGWYGERVTMKVFQPGETIQPYYLGC